MKRTLWFIFFLLNSLFYLYADSENDSLLKVLDKVISERLIYTQKKEATIKELKKKKVGLNSLEDIYNLNKEIIHQYETFVCDSAEQYIHENIDIAKTIGNKEYLLEEQLRLAFVYSLSGLFIQANDIFKSIKCADLPDHLKALYCWNRIRYYENLIKYTDDVRFSNEYISEKEAYRDTVMSILFDQSDEYRKEKAVKLQDKGSTKEALLILTEIYDKQEPASHGYAMMAMGLGEMLGFRIPRNFRHPYMATSVTDFWRRWHMTLSGWFKNYVYIPLGGSRRGLPRTLLNVMIVFLVSGLWHGANWTFILWGALHGLLNVLEKALRIKDRKIPVLLRRGFTFSFVTLAWSIFRAPSLSDSMTLFGRLFSGGFSLYQPIRDKFMDVIEISVLYRAGLGGLMESKPWLILTLFIVVLMAACFTMKNTQEKMALFTFSPEKGSHRKMLWKCLVTAGLLFWSILSLAEISEFLYFTF